MKSSEKKYFEFGKAALFIVTVMFIHNYNGIYKIVVYAGLFIISLVFRKITPRDPHSEIDSQIF